jgi:hypothetical protein
MPMLTLIWILNVLAFVAFAGAVISTQDVNRLLGQALLDVLNANHLAVKVAADIMDLDESSLRKQLRGETGHELRIARVHRLPIDIYTDFWARALYLRGQQTIGEVVDSFGLRREA